MPYCQFTEEELAKEQWKPIPGFGEIYEVSDLGRVRSRWKRAQRHYVIGDSWQIRRLPTDEWGRARITLLAGNGSKRAEFLVHRLVLLAFVGPCPTDCETLHWDDDKRNNRLANLRWGTKEENEADKIRNGHCPVGERSHYAKLKDADIFEIRRLRKNGLQHKEIAAMFGVTASNIGIIVNGKSWQHLLPKE